MIAGFGHVTNELRLPVLGLCYFDAEIDAGTRRCKELL